MLADLRDRSPTPKKVTALAKAFTTLVRSRALGLCCNLLAKSVRRAMGEWAVPLRCPVFAAIADEPDHLGEGGGAQPEGALDDAGLAPDVTWNACAWPLRSARITSKPLMVA